MRREPRVDGLVDGTLEQCKRKLQSAVEQGNC